ncbi:MAG: hypothetical protein JST19_11565 [Bacteroidetes bacterium]|nr:hypothetical protein [Bacteroidota bacterium]
MRALRPYIAAHKPVVVAVDTDDIPDKTLYDGYRRVFDELKKLEGSYGYDFSNSVKTNKRHAETYGFKYLNSEHGIVHNEALNEAMNRGLKQINDDSLTVAHNAWVELSDKRENIMLENIYTYSKEYPYERAVFLLGAAHRKAMIEKINRHVETDPLALNWLFYGG